MLLGKYPYPFSSAALLSLNIKYMRREREEIMKAIDRPVAAIVRFYHVYRDVILGVVLVAVAAYMFYFAGTISIMKEPVSAVDTARFLPRLVFGTMIPVGIVILLQGVRAIHANKETVPEGQALDDSVLAFKRGVIALVSIGIFIALMQPLGFIPAAIIYMIFSMFFMSVKEGWKPVAYVVTAVLVAVLCYYLFKKFVYVQLPQGILKGVF